MSTDLSTLRIRWAALSSGGSSDIQTGTVELNLVIPDHHALTVAAHATGWAAAAGPLSVRSVEVDYVLP